MRKTWDVIERWLHEHAAGVNVRLNQGADAASIAAAEKAFGVKLPAEIKQSYKVHDGQNGLATPLVEDWQLLSLDDAVKQWRAMEKLVGQGVFKDAQGKPQGPVKPEWYDLKWIPFAFNGAGDFLCVDLDPPAGGKRGQVVAFFHVDDRRPVLAPGFKAWLEGLAEHFQRGRYAVHDDAIKEKQGKKD